MPWEWDAAIQLSCEVVDFSRRKLDQKSVAVPGSIIRPDVRIPLRTAEL